MVDLLLKYQHLRAKRSAWRRHREIVHAMRKSLVTCRRNLRKTGFIGVNRYMEYYENLTRETETSRQNYIRLAQDSASLRAVFDELTRIV